ncbi:hypothetical protein COW36_02830 [bacterium (Candidatus Blackallbacteria) CG17_big_fil_post_rev_8_21_14_2_50_48_46]|uniref:Methyltransferase FkbM domain-containing protein n=1 Tax=bacterium (Candidatus Blackallbacteria) CG17_big_fil_post_rev_8_21_14_2_50_48_46 TaxID=2014261 RepID=A0A2M7GA90_9BACT|nr:MAG: hypothetical protein COW64_12645 [bacterium (Candidatus Blackallbacteria) CG18_big_fil_WC_8_21_14_2_50_49_26]PIW19063.1 MAG: hypothetical protein COW36_02830 [bacterium (Candidatus Blackallbacteria) CG17_big_fil_post_rev_8_21_14_2_50_48_46]PIW44570.1 MAG: hypothetical protein COW20_23290 [bacterium (Candidatus Blackallbacteria) CG13_big_fil_rev_8_21_14_2_50_49_14]
MNKNETSYWPEIQAWVDSLQTDYQQIANLASGGLALFGAGSVGHDAVNYLLSRKIPVQCFIDNAPEKQGTEIQGVPVVALQDPEAASAAFILITTKTLPQEVRLQLEKQERHFMTFNAFYVMDNFARYTRLRDQVFQDQGSQVTLAGLMMAMLSNSTQYCAEIMDYNQYFCLPHFLNTDDTFVDAGAFVGDTAEKYIWHNTGMFRHLYLFEPGPKQFQALETRMKRLVAEWALEPHKISMVKAGLSNADGWASFSSHQIKPAASTFSSHQMLDSETLDNVQIYSLDSYFEQHPPASPVSFIKTDTEGMELMLLDGAKQTILKYKPKLALSTYHRIGDLFAITEKIKTWVPEYQVALRHHSPNLAETVLYFWI